MASAKNILAITPGEPAGIGPDLVCLLASKDQLPASYIIADPDLMQQRAKLLKLDLEFSILNEKSTPEFCANKINIFPVTMAESCEVGKLNVKNSPYVLETLQQAYKLCNEKTCHAVITGPVQKSILSQAGEHFSGQTEYFAKLSNTEKVVMMLASEQLRVALATTHLPLAQVPAAITKESLTATIKILTTSLEQQFRINNPKIYICGLNPHAGEHGELGREEIEIITPVIDELLKQGLNLHGPMPADTLFTEKYLKSADAVLAMYHDQGLPVLKHQGFGKAINITLGLPFIRTSVDHGTALSLAGTGKVDTNSFLAAIELALQLREPDE